MYEKITKDLRRYKGKIGIEDIVSEIEKCGYSTVFFNTKEGDEILAAYKIEPNEVKGFTLCGAVKAVFVDDRLSVFDKKCVLLHELAHIMLGHIGTGKPEYRDSTLMEIEADAFTYAVLHPKKSNVPQILLMSLCAVTIFISGITAGRVTRKHDVNQVYITQTGSKYHRANCTYAKDKLSAAIERSEAQRIFEPCSVCNP